jgi:hypothetical protein
MAIWVLGAGLWLAIICNAVLFFQLADVCRLLAELSRRMDAAESALEGVDDKPEWDDD